VRESESTSEWVKELQAKRRRGEIVMWNLIFPNRSICRSVCLILVLCSLCQISHSPPFSFLSLATIPIPFLLHPRRWPRTRTKAVQPIHHFASLFHRDLHHFASLLHRDIHHVAGQEHEGSAAARERSAGRTQSHHRTPIRGRFRRPRPPRRQVFVF